MQYSKREIDDWEQADALDDESMTPEQRLTAALQLFDFYRDTMLGLLRTRNPSATEAEIDLLFRRVLEDDDSDRAAA